MKKDKTNRTKRIMAIDDEEDFLKLVKLNLELNGRFKVFTLSGAEDIISHIYDFKPDLILMDLLMPGIKGLDACGMLKKDPRIKNIPIIVLSALDKDIDKHRAYEVGVVDFLSKPITAEELIDRIEKALAS